MSDENNNDSASDPLSEQPGWAAPDHGQTPASNPPQAPTPNTEPTYSSVPYAPPTSGAPTQNYSQQYSGQPPQRKKSKLWLWITLAIVIPLFLCGLGIGGCTYWAVQQTKPAIDAVNNFYEAAQNGEDLDPFTCEKYLDQGGFNETYEETFGPGEEIDSYDFKNYNNTNGVVTVEGIVIRDGQRFRAKVTVVKDDGKYKVCHVRES